MQRLRLAILGESPCDECFAACCKQNGHDFAVLLQGDEVRKFAPFAIDVHIQRGAQLIPERVLPYRNNRCQFLGDDDRCTIYEDRPDTCRNFPHLVRGSGSIESRMWQMIDRATYCPIVYNSLEAYKDIVNFQRG